MSLLPLTLDLCMVIAGCTDAGCPLVQDNIQRLAVTLYTELLSRLVSLINRYSAVQYSAVQYSTSPGASSPTTSTLLQSYSSTLPASRTPTLLVRRRTVMQYRLTTTCIVSSRRRAACRRLCRSVLQLFARTPPETVHRESTGETQ